MFIRSVGGSKVRAQPFFVRPRGSGACSENVGEGEGVGKWSTFDGCIICKTPLNPN